MKKASNVNNENVIYIPVANDSTFSWVSRVQSELQKTRRVVLVSENQENCGLIGLVRNLRKEYKNHISLLVIDDENAPSFLPEHNIYKDQFKKNLAINVLKMGVWGGYYYISSANTSKQQNIKLSMDAVGDFDSFTWVETPVFEPSNKLVQVCYAGPSYRDARKAAGKTNVKDSSFGMDFSGIDIRGKRVMGLVKNGAIASTIEADPDLLWPVPDHWSLEEAATVPFPYVLAYYCLSLRCTLRKGSSVFVTAGAGALGQAIISICLALDCNVYATVSSVQKKRFLLKLFPQLNEKNIGNSRDQSFIDIVLLNPEDEHCDIVINCQSGHLRECAMKVAGFTGFFLDLSEHDMVENNDFSMFYLVGEKTYKSIMLSSLFNPENIEEKKLIQLRITEGIASGIVRPLSRITYSPTEVSRAFRLLSLAKHRGRALIRIRDPVVFDQGLEVIPRMTYSSENTYAVICGDSDLGIQLVDRLVHGGARKILIHLKDKVTGFCYTKLRLLRKYDVSVIFSSEDLQSRSGCNKLFTEAHRLGPVEGIFIIQDRSNQLKMEQKDFASTFKKSAVVVKNLDVTSRKYCSELKHFVVISCGNQSPVDDYFSSMTESICEERDEAGLPTLMFHANQVDEFNSNLKLNIKAKPQSVISVFNNLESSLKLGHKIVRSTCLCRRPVYDALQKLANILGVKNINDIDENVTLQELRLNDICVEEVVVAIKEANQTSYSNQKLLKMNIRSLKKILCFGEVAVKNKFDSGLGAFFSYIDQDECAATEPIIALPTILSNATEKEEDLDPKATYLMLIPGFEGHHQIFTSICERLKVQAMAFQLDPDLQNDSIHRIATSIMSFIKNRFELKSKFYLLGYSFGVNVALELAALIEKEGHIGIIYCLDSSPDALRVQLDAYLGNLTDTQLQNAIVEHMFHLMTGEHSAQLKQDLNRIENWDDKVEVCVNRLRECKYSNQYKRSILQAAYRRIILARNYKPNFKLESEIVLLKSIPHPKAEKLPYDYNLSQYSKKPVVIYDLESDHALAPEDLKVSNIVNRHLETKVLDVFKNKCLCETYMTEFKMY